MPRPLAGPWRGQPAIPRRRDERPGDACIAPTSQLAELDHDKRQLNRPKCFPWNPRLSRNSVRAQVTLVGITLALLGEQAGAGRDLAGVLGVALEAVGDLDRRTYLLEREGADPHS